MTVALPGDLGKPRPAVIVETDSIAPTEHVLICPATSHVLTEIAIRRVLVGPDERNGLRQLSQFQVDKITVVRRVKCGPVFGALDEETINRLDGQIALLLGLVDR